MIKEVKIFDRTKLNPLRKWWIDIDKINLIIIVGLIIFGVIMTTTSSPAIAKRINVERMFFIKKQISFALIALVILVAISFVNQQIIKPISLFGVIGAISMLAMVLLFGLEAKGAKRWISLLGITLQPSEFAKTFFIIFNAFLLQKFYYRKWYLKYGISAALFAVMAFLIILEPDFGMTITFAALWASQLFIYGLPIYFIILLGVAAAMGGIVAYLSLPHVADRINKFLNAGEKNYQAERSIDGFINGSWFGEGVGNGIVKKFIPDAHTDFIFAVIGEEYGILFCIALIALFLYLITRIVKRIFEEEDMFTYLALCGLTIQFTMQIIVNIGVSLKLLPTKGMTLPFISYGGSSMISMALCFGLILAFTKRKYHEEVDYGNVKLL